MLVLIPTEDKKQELLDNRTPSYDFIRKSDNATITGIDYGYKSKYPTFEEADVYTEEELNPVWHDETKSIQIIQSNDDCLNMIGDYPEIAVYRKENNIETIRAVSYTHLTLPTKRIV